MSSIRYFLPEDGDQEDTPNVFLAPKPSRPGYPPLLGQIKGSFPLPGSYHFRFKTALVPGTDREKNAVPVWMDCVDDDEPVHVWQGAIVAKVTRISMEDEEYDEDFDRVGASRAASTMSAASVHSATAKPATATSTTHSMHSSESLLGGFDDPPAPAAPAASTASSVHSSSGDLLNVDHHPPAPASGGSLLDMDHLGSGANAPTGGHNDLLNMAAPHPTQGGAPPAQPPMQQGRPMQYPPQGQYPQQGMAQMPAPQQQQRGQQPAANGVQNAFGKSLDPLSNLNWG
ncbi:hypothetical protein ACHAXT_010217 [Thalassiosira profunda]